MMLIAPCGHRDCRSAFGRRESAGSGAPPVMSSPVEKVGTGRLGTFIYMRLRVLLTYPTCLQEQFQSYGANYRQQVLQL